MTQGTANGPTIALIANRAMRDGPHSPLISLLRSFEPFIRHILRPRIVAVEGSYRAIRQHGILDGYEQFESLQSGRKGALVELAARLTGDPADEEVDEVIYLIDPVDPTSLYPESLAVKRLCVVNSKPFVDTLAAVREKWSLEWLAADPDAQIAAKSVPRGGLITQTVALIAHDARKEQMLDFAIEHFELLARFRRRIATGTTGALLNGSEPERLASNWRQMDAEAEAYRRLGFLPAALAARLAERDRLRAGIAGIGRRLRSVPGPWIEILRSGPDGGDGQIAARILRGECRYVIFFEDPHVSRQHEADIQLLERAARIPGVDCVCMHDARTARRWAQSWTMIDPATRPA